MLLPAGLCRRLFVCQVRSEFVFRHCWLQLPALLGEQWLHLHLLAGAEAGSADTSQHLYLDIWTAEALQPRGQPALRARLWGKTESRGRGSSCDLWVLMKRLGSWE